MVENDLLGVRGKVRGQYLTFMLDTGASCNFISSDLVRTLGLLKFLQVSESSVRLANGGMLKTLGTVDIRAHFGKFKYVG